MSRSGCRKGVLEGEVSSGAAYLKPIGNGLAVFLQPIASGWILRVVPVNNPWISHDYAELATPPYHSVTALSISTDFSFRSQDAVGWNPRPFRFAEDRALFGQLSAAFARLETFGGHPSAESEQGMAKLIAKTVPGSFVILDARLIPGTADQWRVAGQVASHFNSTAHSIEQPSEGKASPLGKLLWIRFRIEMELPGEFYADASLRVTPRPCAIE